MGETYIEKVANICFGIAIAIAPGVGAGVIQLSAAGDNGDHPTLGFGWA